MILGPSVPCMDDAGGQIAELRALGYEMLRAHEARDLAARARMPARAAELRARLGPELRDHELTVYLTSLAEVCKAAATGRDDRVEAALREFDRGEGVAQGRADGRRVDR